MVLYLRSNKYKILIHKEYISCFLSFGQMLLWCESMLVLVLLSHTTHDFYTISLRNLPYQKINRHKGIVVELNAYTCLFNLKISVACFFRVSSIMKNAKIRESRFWLAGVNVVLGIGFILFQDDDI